VQGVQGVGSAYKGVDGVGVVRDDLRLGAVVVPPDGADTLLYVSIQ
jgi:hypothetical protein